MNKSKILIKLIEEDEPKSSLSKFLNKEDSETEQQAAIEKFRLKKRLRNLKKYHNNTSNDNDSVSGETDREYYWDASVKRVYGG